MNGMDELMKLCGVLIGAMTKISAMEILRRIRFRLAKNYLTSTAKVGTYLSPGQVGWNGMGGGRSGSGRGGEEGRKEGK